MYMTTCTQYIYAVIIHMYVIKVWIIIVTVNNDNLPLLTTYWSFSFALYIMYYACIIFQGVISINVYMYYCKLFYYYSKSIKTRAPTLSEAVSMGEPILDLNRDIPDSSSESDNGSDIPSVLVTDTNMLSVVEDNAVMVSALESIRNVVGEEATDDELKSVLLAADMNVNRAVNYYFGIEDM